MIFSISFASSAFCPSPCIIASNACMLGTSISATTVQYRSAQKSVMTFIGGMPDLVPSFDIARNLSTSGRTLPGLQYITSRMSSMGAPGDRGLGTITEQPQAQEL